MPRHTIRLRLTVLYGVVSVLSAAGLLAITITLAGGWQRMGTAHVPPPAPAGTAASQQAALARAETRALHGRPCQHACPMRFRTPSRTGLANFHHHRWTV